jgi:Domain of unknown function (DUF4432)
VRLFGDQWSREQVLARVGRMEQVASATLVTDEEGPARGARRVVVRCGELAFDVNPDRGLDVGALSFRGTPLTWTSSSGPSAPWGADPSPAGWLRTFAGGLVATCGLDTFGAPSQDEGEAFGMHGRASTLQAFSLGLDARWTDDGDYEVSVTGRLRQARTFGEDLELHRTISCRLGTPGLVIRDVVTNLGALQQPHMVLYHVNLGWPLLDEGALLQVPSAGPVPRDEVAAAGVGEWNTVAAPSTGFAEQVFRHDLDAAAPLAEARLSNPRLGLSLALRVDPKALPHLFQWRMLGTGTYVLGLEPANCSAIEGRAAARARGDLPVLAPGESREYRLEVVPSAL